MHGCAGRIGSRHLDQTFGDGDGHLAAAPADLELRPDDPDLHVVDRHGERPSRIVTDREIGITADDGRTAHLFGDLEGELRLRAEHDSVPSGNVVSRTSATCVATCVGRCRKGNASNDTATHTTAAIAAVPARRLPIAGHAER